MRFSSSYFSLAAFADSLTGKVVKITDGDTLYVLDANYKEHKIRLAGIDAPERKQAYGLASRKHLASIVVGQQVTVEYQKRDRYGRILGKVLLVVVFHTSGDETDVCLEQVKAGLAWHYKKYQYEQSLEDQRLYADAENQARNERLGLWREKSAGQCGKRHFGCCRRPVLSSWLYLKTLNLKDIVR